MAVARVAAAGDQGCGSAHDNQGMLRACVGDREEHALCTQAREGRSGLVTSGGGQAHSLGKCAAWGMGVVSARVCRGGGGREGRGTRLI